jgi:hypothetical protein
MQKLIIAIVLFGISSCSSSKSFSGFSDIPYKNEVKVNADFINHAFYVAEMEARRVAGGMKLEEIEIETPYMKNKQAYIFRLAESTEFVRFSKDSNVLGRWVTTRKDVVNKDGTLMSAAEIKNKLALPAAPKFIGYFILPADSMMRAGYAGKNKWGKGGGRQFQLLFRMNKSMNTKIDALSME